MDRFKLHSSVVNAEKEGVKISKQIEERAQARWKLQRRALESEQRLEQMQKDDKLMRTDLATYQVAVDNDIGIKKTIKTLNKTIEQRQNRLANLQAIEQERDTEFYDMIIGKCQKLLDLKEDAKERRKRPLNMQEEMYY